MRNVVLVVGIAILALALTSFGRAPTDTRSVPPSGSISTYDLTLAASTGMPMAEQSQPH